MLFKKKEKTKDRNAFKKKKSKRFKKKNEAVYCANNFFYIINVFINTMKLEKAKLMINCYHCLVTVEETISLMRISDEWETNDINIVVVHIYNNL